jgi:hypothetical protein
VRSRDYACPPVLGRDHQPGVVLVVGENREPLLISVRKPDDRIPRHFQYRISRFNHLCRVGITGGSYVVGRVRALQSRRHVFGRCPGDGRMSRNKNWPQGSGSLRALFPNINTVSAGSMWSSCWSFRVRLVSIRSTYSSRSRGQPGVSTGSAAHHLLRATPKNVPSKNAFPAYRARNRF